jgi:hypothetical protein
VDISMQGFISPPIETWKIKDLALIEINHRCVIIALLQSKLNLYRSLENGVFRGPFIHFPKPS